MRRLRIFQCKLPLKVIEENKKELQEATANPAADFFLSALGCMFTQEEEQSALAGKNVCLDKMAPVCLAGRRSRLLVLMFAVALFLNVCCRDVSALLQYDRQALFNICVLGETRLLFQHELGDQTAVPPLLSGIPAYLRRPRVPLPAGKAGEDGASEVVHW